MSPRREKVIAVCACDACDDELRPGTAQCDGYCDFCAAECFPAASKPDGTYTRVTLTLDSRRLLHQADAGEEPEAETEALDPRQQMMQQIAAEAGRVVVPQLQKLFQQGMKKLLK